MGQGGSDALDVWSWLEGVLDKLQQLLELGLQGKLVSVIGDDPVEGHALVQAAFRLCIINPCRGE